MVSESGQIIGRLRAAGLSMETIGQAVGRNRSLIRQIGLGAKPGNNLRESLAQLEQRVQGLDAAAPAKVRNQAARAVPVEPAPRRTTAAGSLARVRRPTTVHGRTYATSTMKRTAARSGARGMGHALNDAAGAGREVAVTVSFGKGVQVQAYGKSKRGRAGAGGSVDFKLGDAEEVAAAVEHEHGGNFSEYVAAQALERGFISGVADERDAVQAMVSMELRAF